MSDSFFGELERLAIQNRMERIRKLEYQCVCKSCGEGFVVGPDSGEDPSFIRCPSCTKKKEIK